MIAVIKNIFCYLPKIAISHSFALKKFNLVQFRFDRNFMKHHGNIPIIFLLPVWKHLLLWLWISGTCKNMFLFLDIGNLFSYFGKPPVENICYSKGHTPHHSKQTLDKFSWKDLKCPSKPNKENRAFMLFTVADGDWELSKIPLKNPPPFNNSGFDPNPNFVN